MERTLHALGRVTRLILLNPSTRVLERPSLRVSLQQLSYLSTSSVHGAKNICNRICRHSNSGHARATRPFRDQRRSMPDLDCRFGHNACSRIGPSPVPGHDSAARSHLIGLHPDLAIRADEMADGMDGRDYLIAHAHTSACSGCLFAGTGYLNGCEFPSTPSETS